MRQMKQPRKDSLREQLALAAEEIITLRQQVAAMQRPWWRRLLTWGRA